MESVLCVIKECFVYKIPPRVSAGGYKASEWDVNQFLWSGRLFVVSTGPEVSLKLLDNSGELFALCPVDKELTAVEPVLDSSRYFVIKVVDPASKKYAYLGLGFQDRNYAFDMNVAIQDHFKRLATAKNIAIREESTQSFTDYALKDGEKFSIKIGVVANQAIPKTTQMEEEIAIAPPPKNNVEWDDFGEFQSNITNVESKGWATFD